MNKFVKWGIVGAIAVGFTFIGVNTFMPQVNEDLKEAPVQATG